MDSISRLRELLVQVLRDGTLEHGEQELFDELMVQKPRLLQLLNVGPRSPTEQKEIESGKTVINGKHVAVNTDFARQSIFLSQQLDCSERCVAEALYNVMSENPNIDTLNCLELAIARFHQGRRDLVDCVDLLIQTAIAFTTASRSSAISHLSEFVMNQLIYGVKEVDNVWASRIFREIDGLDSLLATVDNARKCAPSLTTLATGQPGSTTTLGSDLLNSRYESLKYERRILATAYAGMGRLGVLSAKEIKLTVDWLTRNMNHPMSYYMLTAALNALDSADPQSEEWSRRKSTVTSDNLNEYMGKVLSQSTSHIWKDPSLKSVIVLKWTLCQTEARHRDPSLETRAGFRTEELEGQIKSAIEGDAFVYLAYAVFGLLGKRSITSFASLAQKLQIKTDNEQQDHRILPSDDFKPVVLDAFETLIRLLITHASSEIRKIKAKQEDVASARHDRRFATSSSQPDASHRPRTDTAILFSLIGLLYSALPPERALQFWGSGPQSDTQQTYLEYMESTAGRLPSFLQWAVWSHGNDTAMLTALYDMLGGLAKGQQCSELAYNFMARGTAEVIPGSTLPSSSSAATTVSWVGIFGKLDGWARSPNTKPLQQQQQQQQQHFLGSTLGQSLARTRVPTTQNPPISVQDGVYAQAFLHLLSTVVTYSVAVRVAIAGHAQFCAIPTLVSLIPLGIPLELKGAVFETLSSFCEPGAGVNGVEICKAVWTLMEKSEVINVRVPQTGTFGATIPLKGVEAELAEIEAVHKQYPSTIPFLNLLSTLIHTPKRIPSAGRLTDAEPVNTIPETLGQPYRLPGIAPFTAFIVDNVFDNIPNREYSRPSDRWQINDLCLCFIERAVASFDLESLVNHSDGAPVAPDTLVPLLVHPGFDVMKRLLSRTPLQARILSYLVEGVKGFDGNLADEERYFRSTITRVLRIVQRVLEAQDIFLDVLIPLLAEFDSAPIVGPNHTRSFFNRFDLELSFGPQYIPALATYVAFPKYSELVFLSIRILTSLATSMPASNLSTLIGRSSESDRVLAGFVDALSAQSVEDVAHAEVLVEETTGAGSPDLGSQPDLTQSIRLAALSLLIQETEPSRPYPNLAHYILFGTTTSEHQIQDPHALGARRTSIHVILDLLNEGVPRLKGKGKERQREYVAPLFVTLPELAEKCYRVVYHLCTHPRTSDFTTRYLRTREDFFARQLACVPSPAPQTAHTPYIEVLYTDGARVISTSSSLSAFLRLRSCIFDLAALDLHILTSKGHLKGVSELLEILFSNPSDLNGEDEAYQFREIGQSHLRIIEFLQSLMFDWSDSLQVDALDLQFLGQLNIQSCVRINASGCEVIDRTAVFSLLNAAKRALHARGAIATTAHAEQLQREAAYILESCIVENHRREISHSVAKGYQAWRRLLDLTLTKCFDRLPHGQRENMLFDLLHILPTAIRSPYIEEPTAVLLSEVVLSSITKLRENRRQQVIAQSASGNPGSGFLPAERLFAILRNVVECVTENNRVELVRGNLYAALINYVHLLFSPKLEEHSSAATGKSDMSLSLSSSSMREGFSFDDSNSSLGWLSTTQNVGTLYAGSLEALRGSTERLVAIVSRDAIDGTEIWKTVAFMLLDALIQLSGAEKVHIISAPLTKHGILANVVRGVKEADARLLAILKPDPDDLNPLYVYEAKMSFFIRMAQTRTGAERLLEAQIIAVLEQCDFLDARPEADQSFMDRDSFLPSAIQRHHQLLTPALQLIDVMLATLSNKHGTLVHQALQFLTSHSATFTILLKDDSDCVPLAFLEEIHLLVTLSANVLPIVPKSALLSSNSGFGAVHAAILALAARSLGNRTWFASVLPQTDVEAQWAKEPAFGYVSQTKFEVRAWRREQILRKSIIVYLGCASDFTENEITLVLSPITTAQMRREDQTISQYLATIPTVGDAISAVNSLSIELSRILKQIADFGAEVASRDQIAVDKITDVVTDIHISLLQELDVVQKRQLISEEFANVRRLAIRDARVLLDTTEMLLLLLWRHIQHYASATAALPAPSASLSLSSLYNSSKPQNPMNATMRLLSSPDPETFREDVIRRLGPVLMKLEGLDPKTGTEVHSQSQAYIEIMARRIRDSLGLLLDSSRSQQTED